MEVNQASVNTPDKCLEQLLTATYCIFFYGIFLLAFQKHTKSQNIIKAKIAKAITENIFFAISP